jgi:hypothetical protein
MRDYPSRTAHSPLWTTPAAPDAEMIPTEPGLIAAVATLCELLATPTAPATVQMVNRELGRRHCFYRLRRPGGAQRR